MTRLGGRWTVENRDALKRLIETSRSRSPIAVFDWDNTCIRGDIADAVFHRLCADLEFRFEAAGFWDWVTETRFEDRISPAYAGYCSKPDGENRLRLRMSFELTRKALHEGQDDASAWAWDTGAFVGWTEDQVRHFTRRVISEELEVPLDTETIGLDNERVSITHGLRIRAEMRELVRELQTCGWRVWVLSASPRWEVEAFAGMYGIPNSRIIGMRREIIGDRISTQVAPPVSYSDGKLDAYKRFISRDEAPSLVAGDSLGDWKLLESSECTRLLIEPTPSPLREFALWRRRMGEEWLFQDLD